MNHEQHVREPGAKVGPVSVVVTRALGIVDVHALGAVELDHGLAGDVRQADGQHRLVLAVDARAVPKIAGLVLLDHLGDPAVGEDVAGVDEAVEHLGRLLDEVALVRVVLELLV